MRILHFIDSLDYGGAETLLMSYIPLLSEDEHVVVTLNGPNVYNISNYEYSQLNVNPARDILYTVRALRKIITEKKIDIVHSHSYWTNIISRLATPRKLKVFNHYHFADYDTMKQSRSVKGMIWIDKIINRKNLVRVAVSEYVATILDKIFPKTKIEVVPNFINCIPAPAGTHSGENNQLKVVAVGNCNKEKNYTLVLQAFAMLKDEPISIDIIGGGGYLDFYRQEVKRLGLHNVQFCGYESNVREKLMNYDLFLSASTSETFGIAVLEGICAKLPLLLSDIPAFREIAPHNARFFDLSDKQHLVNSLKNTLKGDRNIDSADYEQILHKYSANTFINKLSILYSS